MPDSHVRSVVNHLRYILLVLMVAGVNGCAATPPDDRIDVQRGLTVGDLAWLADGWLYYIAVGGSGKRDQLWRSQRLKGPELVPISSVPGCVELVNIWSLFRVDDKLGISGSCGDARGAVLLSYVEGSTPALLGEMPIATGSVASVRGGQIYADNRLARCSRLLAAHKDRAHWLDVEGVDSQMVELRPSDRSKGPCEANHAAGLPSATAKGDRMALFVAPNGNVPPGNGLSGEATLFYGEVGGPARPLGPEVDRPIAMDLSSDGGLIVFSAHRGARSAVWMISTGSGKTSIVASGRLGEVAISPDSRQVAAVKYDPSSNEHSIQLLDIGTYDA